MYKYIILSLGLVFYSVCALAADVPPGEDPAKFIVTCPIVQDCKPSDGPKKNKSYARDNQLAYDCYRYAGQSVLAEKASAAATKCLTIYGSTNATVASSELQLIN